MTILGWVTLLKGIEKIAFPDRINRLVQRFAGRQTLRGGVIILISAWFFWLSLIHG